MGLSALIVVKKEGLHWFWKVGAAGLCSVLAFYANWNFVGVLWIVIFGLFHGDFKKQMIGFVCVGFFLHIVPTFTYLDFGFEHILPHRYQLFIFAAIPLLALYNGEKGSSGKLISQIFLLDLSCTFDPDLSSGSYAGLSSSHKKAWRTISKPFSY